MFSKFNTFKYNKKIKSTIQNNFNLKENKENKNDISNLNKNNKEKKENEEDSSSDLISNDEFKEDSSSI